MTTTDNQQWQAFIQAARRGRVLVALDNDGVLSRIVSDPTTSRVDPLAFDAVTELVKLPYVEVAILSGRVIDWLQDQFPQDGLTLIGLYGRQWQIKDHRYDHPAVVSKVDDVARGVAFIRELLQASEIHSNSLLLEDKAGITFGISWRPVVHRLTGVREQGLDNDHPIVRDLTEQVRLIEQLVPTMLSTAANQFGLDALVGRVSCELAIPGIDKGTAMQDLFAGLHTSDDPITGVLFLGDERRDRPGWDAVASLEEKYGVVGIRGLVDNDEAGDDLHSAVNMVIDRLEAVPPLLAEIGAASQTTLDNVRDTA